MPAEPVRRSLVPELLGRGYTRVEVARVLRVSRQPAHAIMWTAMRPTQARLELPPQERVGGSDEVAQVGGADPEVGEVAQRRAGAEES